MITVYNLNQAKNSVYNQGLVDRSSAQNRSFYTGFEASFSARVSGKGTVFGSWTAERNLSLFSERWNQLDMNVKKNIRYGHGKVHTFQLDVFNVFNSNAIRTMTDTVGTSLGQVTAILPGRFPRLAYQFKW